MIIKKTSCTYEEKRIPVKLMNSYSRKEWPLVFQKIRGFFPFSSLPAFVPLMKFGIIDEVYVGGL